VAIAAVLFAIGGAAGRILPPESVVTAAPGAFISRLAWINLALVAFNMLPAFPMDGGRVLRAFLAMRMDYLRATEIAARLGKIMAVGFGLLAFFGNFFLLFIALFVYVGAQQEAQHTRLRSLTRGLTAGQAMMTSFAKLSPDQTLRELIDLIQAGYQQDFVVVADGKPKGVLPRAHLLSVLPTHEEETPVEDVMLRDFKTIDATEMLSGAFEKMQATGHPLLPVVQHGELVGVLTPASIGQFVMMHAALKQAPGFPFRQTDPTKSEIPTPHFN
jgi:CBS domain-containing protein